MEKTPSAATGQNLSDWSIWDYNDVGWTFVFDVTAFPCGFICILLGFKMSDMFKKTICKDFVSVLNIKRTQENASFLHKFKQEIQITKHVWFMLRF